MKTFIKKSILLVFLSSITFQAISAGNKEGNNKKPNILFIAVDDLKPILGCYGDKLVKTPNIDRLAAKGMVFKQNYCQEAICGPSRASLMTGKRPDYTKVWDLETTMREINPEILTIPQYFKQQGYTTLGIGKIYDPRCVGNGNFQTNLLDKESWTVPYYFTSNNYYYKGQKPVLYYYQSNEAKALYAKINAMPEMKGKNDSEKTAYGIARYKPSVECIDLPDNAYNDGAQTDRTLELLKDLSKSDQSFFFAVGFARPHLPFVAPKKYWDLYKRDEMPLAKFQQHAKNSPDLAYTKSSELRAYTDIPALSSFSDMKGNGIGVEREKQKELIHGYYASVSYIDAQVGRILATLEELGMSENTIVVLWGDHGWHLGDHDLWCKHTNFEQAARAPLLISVPGMKSGKTQELSELIDIFPTLCDLSGLKIPEILDGKSLVPLMHNPKSKVKDFAVSQYPHEGKMGYSIRTKQYRLTWWMENGFRSNNKFSNDLIIAKELFDYKKDPLETVNVVNEKKYKAITADLEIMMLDYFSSQASVIK